MATPGQTLSAGTWNGKSITKHQAEEILEYDIQRAESIVENAVTVPLNGNQFSALVSFVFNVGHGKRGEKSGFVVLKDGGPSSLLRKLNEGAPLSAAEEFPKWNKGTVDGKLVVLPGLVKRRAAERALFLELPA
jgi:lysozyme